VEKQLLSRIMERLTQGMKAGAREAIGPYIGATMFVPAAQLPVADLSMLPPDIQEALRS